MIFHVWNKIVHTYQDYTSVIILPSDFDLVLHRPFFTAIWAYNLRWWIIFIDLYGIAASRTCHRHVAIGVLLLFPKKEPPDEKSGSANDYHTKDDNQRDNPASQHEIPLYYFWSITEIGA